MTAVQQSSNAPVGPNEASPVSLQAVNRQTSSAPQRISFGILDEQEIDQVIRDSMASGGLVFGPAPVGPPGKFDPASRAPLSFSHPSNMQSLRRATSVKRRQAEASPLLLSSTISPPPALSLPTAPVASTSRGVVQAQPKPAGPPSNEHATPRSATQAPLASAIDLQSARGPSRPTQPPPSTRPPSTALSLTPDHPSFTSNRRHPSPPIPQSALLSKVPRSPQMQPTPAVTFSAALKPPVPNKVVQLRQRPPRSPAPVAATAETPTSAPTATPNETPVPSSGAPSTAPTSPLLSSPPTRTTSPKPALKPKSWADLVRPANSISPTRKRVSIALPSEPASPTSSAAPPSTFASPSSRPSTIPPTLSVPSAPVQVPALAPAVPPPTSAQPAAPMQPTPPRQPAPKRKLGEILSGIEGKQKAPLIQPRGLVNKGNQCFENSILQVLLFCGPMYNLLRLIGQETTHDFSNRYPTLEAMIDFVEEFTIGRRGNDEGQTTVYIPSAAHRPTISDAFTPDMVYEALKGNKRFDVMMRGSQEDAQEFLGFLLDTLHEELLALIDRYDNSADLPQPNGSAVHTRAGSTVSNASSAPATSGDDGWLEVGSKGRMATTRSAEARESPLSRIFGGKQRSTLRVPGQKDSATVEPFLTLQLDIQPDSVETIEDAIAHVCLSDTISDYTAQAGGRVDAMKQLSLESLPPVLILHLKRFGYDQEAGATIKNHKVVGFGTELDIAAAWVSPAGRRALPLRYTLSAVVYHHGRQATGGHYTTSIRKQDGQWINIDDTTITEVGPADVAIDRTKEVLRLSLPSSFDGLPERSAYLLVWTRL